MLRGQHRAGQIDLDDAVPRRHVDRLDVGVAAFDPGVGEGDVEPAEPLADHCHQPVPAGPVLDAVDMEVAA